MIHRMNIPMTVSAIGALTKVSDHCITGKLLAIRYNKTDFANGSTITITSAGTEQSLLAKTSINATETFYPRDVICTAAGVDSVFIASGQNVQLAQFVLYEEQIKVVVADGGVSKSGALEIYWED